MQKDLINVLLIDDDMSFGKACTRMIEQQGFKVTWAKTPLEAVSLAKANSFQVILVDCMLPKTPGVELALQLKPLQTDGTLFILMSGIYKDKNFIRQAMQRTGLKEFLVKPFSAEDFESILNEKFDGLIEEAKDPLPKLFASDKIRPRKILEAIEESDNVHGFELPFIYSLLLNAKISGQMNIAEDNGNIFGVTFCDGRIIGVETDDPPTQIGEFLVEKGLVERDDIEFEMAKPSSQKIGKRLVENNLLSPHILDEILVEQMGTRLSKTILESSVQLNFTEASLTSEHFGIDIEGFVILLSHWLENKISQAWLKSYYLPWLDYKVKEGSQYAKEHPIFSLPNGPRLADFYKDLLDAGTVQSLLGTNKYPEKEIFILLHMLTITRCLGFGGITQTSDYETQRQRLEKMLRDLKTKNCFEVLNLSKNARPAEIRRAYAELSKILSPENLASDAPEDIRQLNEEVFSIIQNAYDIVSDDEKRKDYLKEIREQNAKRMLVAENLVEQGKQLLATGQAQKALEKFNEAFEMNRENLELVGYRIWARLKILGPKKKVEELQQIDRELSSLSQHGRQSALFHFVKGLLQKEMGNLTAAKTSIENAINIDPNFLEARRELNVIKLKQKKDQPVDILRGDLRDVVGMLFRRK